jgi:hypothetical protein
MMSFLVANSARATSTTASMVLNTITSTPPSEMQNDTDADGLTDSDEYAIYHTDPQNADSDGDGYADGEEIRHGYSPLRSGERLAKIDTDHDSLSDELELKLGTNLLKKDSDGDNMSDRDEVYAGRNPLSASSTTSTVKRLVQVDLNRQQLTYFFNGIKLGTMPVSTGKIQTPTPPGSFKVIRKLPVHRYVGADYDLPNTKWNLEFKRSYYIHGAYWHNQFGIRTMSHGCVNMAYRDVEKLYAFLQVGDTVEITGKTPRGKIANPITLPTTEEFKKAIQQIAEQPRSSS